MLTEEMDREIVKKIVQGTSTAPANVVGERASLLSREGIEKIRQSNLDEDLAISHLMEVISFAKAGKPWKEHMPMLKAALEKAPITRAMLAESLKGVGNALQSH